jgi:hypothetical protein
MARFETFARDIQVATAGLSDDEISREVARFAKTSVGELIRTGEASSNYTRFVNGREGAPEEAFNVRSSATPGPILYEFAWWHDVITGALAELVKRSPKRSGRYSRSFIVLANQLPVTNYQTVDGAAEVIIFNAQPYTRKIEVGAMSMSVAPRHFEGTAASLRRKYGRDSFSIITRFLDIRSGIDPRVPYLLRGEYASRYNAQRRAIRSGASISSAQRLARRKSLDVGQPITYPALVINLVH